VFVDRSSSSSSSAWLVVEMLSTICTSTTSSVDSYSEVPEQVGPLVGNNRGL
jgi:hypothetical protein